MRQIKGGLYALDFTGYNAPNFTEKRVTGAKDYIEYGEENAFPTYLVDLFNGSSVHNAILTGKVNYIVGRGLTFRNDLSTIQRAMIEAFIFAPNPYETWNEIFKKIALDYELYNGFALEIINDSRGKISEVYHADFGKYRTKKEDKTQLYYSDSWLNDMVQGDYEYRRNYRPKIEEVAIFNPNKTQAKSVYYYREYRPNFNYYPLPDYIGALQAIRTQVEIANFDLNTIVNGFAGGTLVNLFNGQPPDDEEKASIERQFHDKAAGSNNGNRILLNFADSKEYGGAEILPLMGNDLPDRFKQLEERVTSGIFVGHKVTSPMLFGVKTEGQLGGRTELLEAYEIFKETYIQGRQATLLNAINDIFEYKGFQRVMGVEELKPMQKGIELSEPTLISLFDRQALTDYASGVYGIKGAEVSNVVDDNEAEQMRMFAAQDDEVLNYFKGKGESVEKFEIIVEYDVTVDADGVKFAIQEDYEFADPIEKLAARVAQLVKANEGITIAELSQAVKQDVKEVEKAVKHLVDRKMVVRADNGKMKITRAAMPLILTLPNPDEILMVKYMYGLRPDASGGLVIAGTRDFCREMVSSAKLFTRKEIEGMTNDMKVSFLPNIQDVWLYRGGWYRKKGADVSVPFCRHIWKQVVVKEKA
jgi:hypothetical protein